VACGQPTRCCPGNSEQADCSAISAEEDASYSKIGRFRTRHRSCNSSRQIKHLKIRELEGALLARSVSQVDLAFVFANYALEAGIDTSSALIVEKGKDLYVEYLVARPDNINDPRVQKLAKALSSDEVRQFILTRYKGQIAPGF